MLAFSNKQVSKEAKRTQLYFTQSTSMPKKGVYIAPPSLIFLAALLLLTSLRACKKQHKKPLKPTLVMMLTLSLRLAHLKHG